MNVHEWSLVIFTIITQMAVGSFVLLGGIHFFAARKYGIENADKLSDRALLAIGPVLVLGVIATFFHLGNPINAPRAISNLGSSWLSREIALVLVFTVGGAVFAFMQWRKIGSSTIRNVIALVIAAVGLVLIYAMASVYLLPTIPAWNTFITPVSFYVTTFLLGALAIGSAYVITYWRLRGHEGDAEKVQYNIVAITLRWLALISLVMLGVQFVVIPLYVAGLATNPTPAAMESAMILTEVNSIWFVLRLGLLFVGAGVFSLFLYRSAGNEAQIRVIGNLAYGAFALVFIAEVIGRYLFYTSMVRIGI